MRSLKRVQTSLFVSSVISGCVSAPGQPDPLGGAAIDLLENIRNAYEVQTQVTCVNQTTSTFLLKSFLNHKHDTFSYLSLQNGEGDAGLCKLCEVMVAQLMALASGQIMKVKTGNFLALNTGFLQDFHILFNAF